MKEVLSIFIKHLFWGLAGVTLMLGSLLLVRGEGGLIGALLLGYMAALVFGWNMAWRLWGMAEAPPGGAAKQVLVGLVVRMVVLLLILLTAINISAKVFGVTALGFLLCYGMAVFLLIHMNLR